MSNCKDCGYGTCMAYANAFREGEVGLKDCRPLWEEKREKREKLRAYPESFGWRAPDE